MNKNYTTEENGSDFTIEDGEVNQDLKEISFEDEKLKIGFQEVDLDQLEADEALGELFEKISPLTIPSVIIGVILLIISFTNVLASYPIWTILLGFAGGLSFIFGCSELIIFGVKSIGRKLDWSEYFMGIIAALGADSSDIIVVSILLLRAKTLTQEGNVELANRLALTSITFILTTVLINILVLGVTMIIVSKKKPFKLPNELTQTEANLVLAMTIFSFIMMSFGFTHDAIEVAQFDRLFEGVIGVALLLFYLMFIFFLIGDAKQKRTENIGPQTLISEFFPEDDDEIEVFDQEKNGYVKKEKSTFRKIRESIFKKNDDEDEEGEQFIALRRFPLYLLIIAFVIGLAGMFLGGSLISKSIETGIEFYDVPILVYCVVVGFVSSAPETTITMRALFDPEKEDTQIGLVHQVSSINQTFFLLFGFPFLLASLINVAIPVAFDTTLVFAGIFALSLSLHLTIIDDNHFDRVEGALIVITSIASLIALGIMGTLLN